MQVETNVKPPEAAFHSTRRRSELGALAGSAHGEVAHSTPEPRGRRSRSGILLLVMHDPLVSLLDGRQVHIRRYALGAS